MATEEMEEPDYAAVLGKPATNLQRRMAEWIQGEEVGYNPAAAKTKLEAFEEGVRIAVALRMPYQASTHNRTATVQERVERDEAKALLAREREEAKAAKAAAAPVQEAPVPTAKPVKAAKATKPAKATKAAAPAAAPAPAARPAARRAPARRAPAAAAATPSEAPF